MGKIWKIDCIGCGREKVVCPGYFPDDYPRDLMMCCACTSSFYWRLGIPNPPRTNGYRTTEFFCKVWWEHFGKRIEKAMVIQ